MDPGDITYSLLETTLAMLNALQYLPNFKKFGIDSSVLPLLTDEDLKTIGVDDEQLRSKLIKQCSNLRLSLDSRLDLTVNEKYLMTVLNEVDHHLLLLDASLTYALKRKNIQRCDVKLHKGSKCLIHTASSMQKELRNFYYLFSPRTQKKSNQWMIAVLAIVSAATSILAFKKYLRH